MSCPLVLSLRLFFAIVASKDHPCERECTCMRECVNIYFCICHGHVDEEDIFVCIFLIFCCLCIVAECARCCGKSQDYNFSQVQEDCTLCVWVCIKTWPQESDSHPQSQHHVSLECLTTLLQLSWFILPHLSPHPTPTHVCVCGYSSYHNNNKKNKDLKCGPMLH